MAIVILLKETFFSSTTDVCDFKNVQTLSRTQRLPYSEMKAYRTALEINFDTNGFQALGGI